MLCANCEVILSENEESDSFEIDYDDDSETNGVPHIVRLVDAVSLIFNHNQPLKVSRAQHTYL